MILPAEPSVLLTLLLLQSDLRLFRTGMKPGDSRKSKMCVDNKRHTSAHQPWPPTHQMGIQSLLLRHLAEYGAVGQHGFVARFLALRLFRGGSRSGSARS